MTDTLHQVQSFTNGQSTPGSDDDSAIPFQPVAQSEILAKADTGDATTNTFRDNIPGMAPFGSFKMSSVDSNLEQKPPMMKGLSFRTELEKPPSLGPLAKLQGSWVGTGFNMIFRPRNKFSKTIFQNELKLEGLDDDNLLQMNLTSEQLTFLDSLGEVPNRGLNDQRDIFLNGIPYTQIIKDATNTETGRADLPVLKPDTRTTIHFETGMMMFIPKSDIPKTDAQILRMANIPHGTSINARGPATSTVSKGGPEFPSIDITPNLGRGRRVFPSQKVEKNSSCRLPQNLDNFVRAGTIDQDVLTDPNAFLRKQNKKTKFIDTESFFFNSDVPVRNSFTGKLEGDENTDIMNIPFLRGDSGKVPGNPNANTVHVMSQFWISTVEHTLTVPVWKPGSPAIPILTPSSIMGNKTPLFQFISRSEIPTPKQVTVQSTQIMYSQTILLQFAGLNWPHVSVATLVPAAPIVVSI